MLFNYVRNLDFDTKPDYGYMKKGLRAILDTLLNLKPVFDWHLARGE